MSFYAPAELNVTAVPAVYAAPADVTPVPVSSAGYVPPAVAVTYAAVGTNLYSAAASVNGVNFVAAAAAAMALFL
ncbi:hypothetical protein HDU81_001530 [Chytriomyces hyalinus]|nr:hypothetical protein HDU81_001530 [Chytriomyces hyalinus]